MTTDMADKNEDSYFPDHPMRHRQTGVIGIITEVRSGTKDGLPKRYTMKPKRGDDIQGAVDDFEELTPEQLAKYYHWEESQGGLGSTACSA